MTQNKKVGPDVLTRTVLVKEIIYVPTQFLVDDKHLHFHVLFSTIILSLILGEKVKKKRTLFFFCIYPALRHQLDSTRNKTLT
jgi:hypothetical protein